MTPNSHIVTVEQVPESLNPDQGRIFLRQLQKCMNVNRPRVVLDCSRLGQMDKPTTHLILSCLEEAMKRNGDVRLAGVSAATRAVLESVGADRLFQIFVSNADAMRSFHGQVASVGVCRYPQDSAGQVSENAV
jgi:anti-anti-sigma regulatory factor